MLIDIKNEIVYRKYMTKGHKVFNKESAKVLVKKQDFLKKYGLKTHMRLKRKIYGEEEYEKYYQEFRNEYKEGVIEDYNSSKNEPGYQKKLLNHVLKIS